jgi:hypothetical protein
MRRTLLIVTAVSAGLGLFFLYENRIYPLSRGGEPGSGLFPLIIGLWLLATSLIVAGETYSSHQLAAVQVEWPDRVGLLRMLGIAAACLVFILLLGYLGDLGAGVLTILLVLRLMGMQRWRYLVPTAIVMTAITHWLFASFLGVPLPQGTLFG